MQVINVPEKQDQLKALMAKLTGHQAFHRCRGEMMGILSFKNAIEMMKNISPTQFLNKWDSITGDVRILLSILAQFKRDGWDFAADCLEKALTDPTYLFPGEEIPMFKSTNIIHT